MHFDHLIFTSFNFHKIPELRIYIDLFRNLIMFKDGLLLHIINFIIDFTMKLISSFPFGKIESYAFPHVC